MLKFMMLSLFMSFVCFDFIMMILWTSSLTFILMATTKFCFSNYILMNYFSLNSFSLGLSILTLFMIILFLNSMKYLQEFKEFSYLLMLTYFMNFIVISTFLTYNLLNFYIFFEFSLIPIFLIIMGWGYQPERLSASLYMLFYTIFFSLPLMIYLLSIYFKNFNLTEYNHTILIGHSLKSMMILSSGLLAFMVKLPIYTLHIWLPKAHVEAPVGGSMFLASILLKLGIYGIFRILSTFILTTSNLIMSFLTNFTFLGGLMSAIICLYQFDLKVLIAYSSVAHMGMSLAALLTLTNTGLSGAYSMSISHGFCSSSLFFLSFCNYKRTNSRSFYFNKGLLNTLPSMMMLWLIFSIINMSAPPFLNIFSEIFMISSLMSFSFFMTPIIILMLFFSCSYSLYLFSFMSHGKTNKMNHSFQEGKILEYITIFMHLSPLILLIFIMEASLEVF